MITAETKGHFKNSSRDHRKKIKNCKGFGWSHRRGRNSDAMTVRHALHSGLYQTGIDAVGKGRSVGTDPPNEDTC